MTCGRNPGAFREPVYILREKAGFPDWTQAPIDEKRAVRWAVEKLIKSFGISDPVHISHISGYRTADLLPIFASWRRKDKSKGCSERSAAGATTSMSRKHHI